MKDKRAAKLKEIRKAANTETHIALFMTKCVEQAFNRFHIDKIYDRVDAYRALHKNEWFRRCFIPFERLEEIRKASIDKNAVDGKLTIDLGDLREYSEVHNMANQKHITPQDLAEYAVSEFREAQYLLPLTAGWRKYKEVFKFDGDFLKSIITNENDIEKVGNDRVVSPKELDNLPFPTFYVEAPYESAAGKISGFFFGYNSLGGHDGENLLDFYFVNENEATPYLFQVPFHVPALQTLVLKQIKYDLHEEEGLSVWECYQRDCHLEGYNDLTEEEKAEVNAERKRDFCLLMFGLEVITYLSSRFADVKINKSRPYKRDRTVRDVPIEIRHWDVGMRMGTVIREMKQAECEETQDTDENKGGEKKRSSPKPYARRAYHQYYWYGKKDGSEVRYRQLKFIEATLVNVKSRKDLENIPAVYHPVISYENE